MSGEKAYLGDGVHAELIDNMAKLTAGGTAIYLEPEVLERLNKWATKAYAEARAAMLEREKEGGE